MKYINFKRYKFSTIVKKLDMFRHNLLKLFKFDVFKVYNFKKIYKYLDITRFDLKKFGKYFNIREYNIYRLKKINLINNKVIFLHFPLAVIFFGFLYLFIPTFYNYESSNIESIVCKKKNIKCSIKGKVGYIFYPTPRLVIKDLTIFDFFKEKKHFVKSERTVIKLSIKNLLSKEKQKLRKIEIKNYEMNFDLDNFKKYKAIFAKKINYIPVNFINGKITLFDKENYVATISEVNLNLKLDEYSKNAKLEGKFLNDSIFINLDSSKIDNKLTTDVILKMSNLNLLTKINLLHPNEDKSVMNGNVLIKKGKNKFLATFNYEDDEIKIIKSTLKNSFLDGKLEGKISFLPFFDYVFDLNLNSINFTKLYSSFLALDEKSKKELFKINYKINGKLNLSSNKVYSRYNLVKSFESRLIINNGSILIDQFLINLGKLGAADVLGSIKKDKKFYNFNFESNIFVDDQKKFLSKFGIYNKKKIPSNFYVSGNLDLNRLQASFYEISDEVKLKENDINYIEKEFNNLMLEDGYNTLFYFPKFKEFIKSITDEQN